MYSQRLSGVLLALGCCVFLFGVVAQAESTNATITGRILDPAGAVIVDAEVSVISTQTGVRYSGRTDGEGIYLVPDIHPGMYRVEVSKPGFKTLLKPDVVLHIQAAVVLNFTLTFGSVVESITVGGGAPLVGTEASSVGTIIEGREVTDLPLNGRNFTQLALLTPGVTRGAYGDNASGGLIGTNVETYRNSETGGAALSVNGIRPQANNFLLDGLDNNESLVNTIVLFAPAEAIQEFRVNTSVAPAEFGRAGGAIVQTSIKSGTNEIHGSAFEFLRNSALDANDAYFGSPDPATGKVPKLPFRRNQFGATLGLPLIRNRLFLFTDYQGLRSQRYREPEFVTVPTPAMRRGDFSELLGTGYTTLPDPRLTGCAQTAAVNGAIYDPLTCAPFPDNQIPQDRMNPVGQNYLNAFPLPTLPGIKNNYETQRRDLRDFDDFDVRLDYALTNTLLFARYSAARDNFTLTSLLPTLPSGFGSGNNPTHLHSLAIGSTSKLSAAVVNDFRLGYSRDRFAYEPPFAKQPLAQELGIPNANRNSLLGGGALIGGGGDELVFSGDGGPYVVGERTWQGNDNVSWSIGRHTLRAGVNVIHRSLEFFQGNFAKGYFLIGGTERLGTGRFTGYEVSELLAGFTDYQIGSGQSTFTTYNWETGQYMQDDWRVNDYLTLNLGVRYDLYTNPAEVHERQSNFDVVSGKLLLPGQNGLPHSLVSTQRNNWAPRFGFSFAPWKSRQFVVHGGYGIFYFLDRGGVGNQLSNNPDFNGLGTYQAAIGYRFTLSGAAPLGSSDNRFATGALPPAAPVVDRNAPRNASVIAIPPRNPTSMVQQWNLRVEQQLGADTAVNIAYVGNKADHLMTWFDLNSPILNTTAGTSLFPDTGLVVNLGSGSGSSHYDSMQAQLSRRFAEDLQYTVSYTWAHTRDDTNGPFSVTARGGSRIFVFPGVGGDLALNRGDSDQDVRQFFTASVVYELPFGYGKRFGSTWNRLLTALAGGWQWNHIVTLGSGTPFDLLANGSPTNRPDYFGGANAGIRPTANGAIRYLDYYAFSAPPVNATGVYTRPGSLGRNHFHGPGIHTWDMSLFKTFDVLERFKLQLRAEAYNVLNTPQFTNPDPNWSDGPGSFGIIRSTRAFTERQMQLALRVIF